MISQARRFATNLHTLGGLNLERIAEVCNAFPKPEDDKGEVNEIVFGLPREITRNDILLWFNADNIALEREIESERKQQIGRALAYLAYEVGSIREFTVAKVCNAACEASKRAEFYGVNEVNGWDVRSWSKYMKHGVM